MKEKLLIRLFDTLSIERGNEKVLKNLDNTRKTKLFLAYLILNMDRAVPHKELFELLWSGQEYANPGTALRTLLYRYRAAVDEAKIDELKASVYSKKGTYSWNDLMNVRIDICEFEESIEKSRETKNEEEKIKYLKTAIDLYRGNLLNDCKEDHWVVPKLVKYRDLYIEAIHEYVNILNSKEEVDEIVKLLEKAMAIVGKSDILRADYSYFSATSGQADMASRRQRIINNHSVLNRSMDVLSLDMESRKKGENAFVCTYDTFKDIYHLQRRLLARTGETMFLSLLYIKNYESEEKRKKFLECARKSLRCGDSLCDLKNGSIAVMFPAGSFDDAVGVMERLRKVYSGTFEGENFTYVLKPLKNANE